MRSVDVLIAGGGVAGLLVASALPAGINVVLVEQADELPRRKYWLTDREAATLNPDLADCVDSVWNALDFVAHNGATATVPGMFTLWDTNRLSSHLEANALRNGLAILTGRRLYAVRPDRRGLTVRVSGENIRTRLMVDCMGFGSPLVGAHSTASISGYYVVYGAEVHLRRAIIPVGLDNVIAGARPTYFELFPTGTGTAHAAVILPTRSHRPDASIKADWNFIVQKSHYAEVVDWRSRGSADYFGIIPVGRLRKRALDRTLFFGESAQANPATSATALTRMLRTYRDFGAFIVHQLHVDQLDGRTLARHLPAVMSPMNRAFQECLFERVLEFTSEDFRELVEEIARCPPEVVSDLVFASFPFNSVGAARLGTRLVGRPGSLLARTWMHAVLRRIGRSLLP